jgi:hypothetical protein
MFEDFIVGLVGFEPTTSGTRSQYATVAPQPVFIYNNNIL